MDELEGIMRAIPLRAPSPDLDRRVMEAKPAPEPGAPSGRGARRWVPALTAAALAALGIGLIFWLSSAPPSPPPIGPLSTSAPTVSTNPFDFTRPSSFFPPGELEVVVRSPKGN